MQWMKIQWMNLSFFDFFVLVQFIKTRAWNSSLKHCSKQKNSNQKNMIFYISITFNILTLYDIMFFSKRSRKKIKLFFNPATKALPPPFLELSGHIFGGDFFWDFFEIF